MELAGLLTNPFAPRYQRDARAALARPEPGALDSLEASVQENEDAARVWRMTEQARRAASDPEAVRRAGLEVLAAGVQPGAPFHAGVALRLLEASKLEGGERDALGQELLGRLNPGQDCAALSRIIAGEAAHTATLAAMATGAATPGAVAVAILATLPESERYAAGQRALEHLAPSSTLARMARDAVERATYRDTREAILNSALHTLDAKPQLAVQALSWMDSAYAGRDARGDWKDEKTPVVLATLKTLSAADELRPRERLLAGVAAEAIEDFAFTSSVEGTARITLETMAKGIESDEQLAAALSRMVEAATTGHSDGKYRDDKSVMARVGAARLAAEAKSERVRHLAQLTGAVLEPGKFTESNQAVAQAGFGAISNGRKADDRGLAQTVREMIAGSLNTNTQEGSFQADKSTVIEAATPFLLEHLENPAPWELMQAASQDLSYADSREKMALAALAALGTNSNPGQLASRLMDCGFAGETSAGWKDEQSPAARAMARYLTQHGSREAQAYAGLILQALADTSFTQTNQAVAKAGFEAIAEGRLDDQSLAKTARAMVKGAVNSNDSHYTFKADKSRVSDGIRASFAELLTAPESQAVLKLWDTVGSNHFADSAEGQALRALEAIARGRGKNDAQLARLARDMVEVSSAADDSSGNYKDDKSPVARKAAGLLAQEGSLESTRRLAQILVDCEAATTFTKTREALGELVFKAIESGQGELKEVARLGESMVSKALATDNSRYVYTDDKTPVARVVLQAVSNHPQAGEQERRVVGLALAAMDAATFTKSNEAVAQAALRHVARGRDASPPQLADLARTLIEAGHVDTSKQDQGPIAVGVFKHLAHHASGEGETRHLILAGMMDTDADYRQRVGVASRALKLWSSGVGPEASELARRVLEGVPDQDRSRMLAGAVRTLASSGPDPDELSAQVSENWSEDELLKLLDELAPDVRSQLEDLAKALEGGPTGNVQVHDEAVWIEGFEVPLNQGEQTREEALK